MTVRFRAITFSFIFFVACSNKKEISTQTETISTVQRDTSYGQKEMTLLGSAEYPEMPWSGIAYDQKGGATVHTDWGIFWVDNLDSWPDGWNGKPIRISGEIVEKNDNPVFVDTSKTIVQGIPVENTEQATRHSKRIWIVNAKYELIRP